MSAAPPQVHAERAARFSEIDFPPDAISGGEKVEGERFAEHDDDAIAIFAREQNGVTLVHR